MVITGSTRNRFGGQKLSRGFESPSLRQCGDTRRVNRRDARAAEGARLEIVCILKKVYRGFESPSLRQEQGSVDRGGFFSDPYSLIPKILIAGSRATKDCEPRQIRKEATAAITDVCCG